jgi:hypothetical protein
MQARLTTCLGYRHPGGALPCPHEGPSTPTGDHPKGAGADPSTGTTTHGPARLYSSGSTAHAVMAAVSLTNKQSCTPTAARAGSTALRGPTRPETQSSRQVQLLAASSGTMDTPQQSEGVREACCDRMHPVSPVGLHMVVEVVLHGHACISLT